MLKSTISIASIGDCCVDIYPDHQKIFLGGTAYNVAVQARNAGAQASLISAVGDDAYGKMFYESCRSLGINVEQLAMLSDKTSSVDIPLDAEGRPVFSGWELGVLSEFILTAKNKRFLEKHQAIRGILLKPLKKLFKSFSDMELVFSRGTMHHTQILKVGDFAGGSQYSVEKEEIVEYIPGIDVVVRSCSIADTEEVSFLKALAQNYHKIVLVLLGKEGSVIFTKEKEYRQPAFKTTVIDTTGAGDAYIANFIISYLQTKDIHIAMKAGTKAAANVITYLGASG